MPLKNNFEEFTELESTQDRARINLQKNPAPNEVEIIYWVRADSQVAGRGRAGRSWLNDRSGSSLLTSAAFHFAPMGAKTNLLPLFAGWVFFETIAAVDSRTASRMALKWPNDLGVFEGDRFRKLGGVLCESPFRGAYVVGWGANLQGTPTGVVGTLSLQDIVDKTTKIPAPQSLLGALAENFRNRLDEWAQSPPSFERALLKDITEGPMATNWGRMGRLESGESAIARSLADDGALIVQEGDLKETRKVYAGDFSFSR